MIMVCPYMNSLYNTNLIQLIKFNGKGANIKKKSTSNLCNFMKQIVPCRKIRIRINYSNSPPGVSGVVNHTTVFYLAEWIWAKLNNTLY